MSNPLNIAVKPVDQLLEEAIRRKIRSILEEEPAIFTLEEYLVQQTTQVKDTYRALLAWRIDELAKLLLEYPVELNSDKLNPKAKREELYISPLCAYYEHVLIDLILQLKQLTEYSTEAQAKDVTLLGYRKAGTYGGLEYLQCLRHAKKRFGMTDNKSKTLVPFMQHFNWLLKHKKKNILEKDLMEQDSVTYDLRQQEVKELLAKAYAEKGLEPGQALDGYISQERAGKLLDELVAGEELRKAVKAAFARLHAEAGEKPTKEGEDVTANGGALERSQVEDYWEAECVADRMLYMLDKADTLASLVSGRNFRKDYVAYLTLKAVPYLMGFRVEDRITLVERLDKELLRFALKDEYEHEPAHRDLEAEAYAAYLSIAYDTARKRLNKVEELLAYVGDKTRRASVAIAKQKRAEAKAPVKATKKAAAKTAKASGKATTKTTVKSSSKSAKGSAARKRTA